MKESLSTQAREIQTMFGRISKKYDFLNAFLSGGMDSHWRRVLARRVKKQHPERVLDLATGSGDVILALNKQRAYGKSCFGSDFSYPMLLQAKKKKIDRLSVADGLQLPFRDQTFDAITIAFGFRNFVDRAAALTELRRVLKVSGRLYILEFSHPYRLFRSLYFWFLEKILPRAARLFGSEQGAYEYLSKSIYEFPNQTALQAFLEKNGFVRVEYRNLSGGIVALHEARINRFAIDLSETPSAANLNQNLSRGHSMNANSSVIELSRDVEAIQIPSGHKSTLNAGASIVITQDLGGTYTVAVQGQPGLYRISDQDADALGKESTKEMAPQNGHQVETVSEEAIWNQLKTCYDPEIPVNIVDLGLVYSMEMKPLPGGGSSVEVKMTLTAPGCGMGPTIASDAQYKILSLPGVTEARVDVVWDPPWGPERISPEGKVKLGMA